MTLDSDSPTSSDWRDQRRAGTLAIAGSMLVFALLWLGVRYCAPIPQGLDSVAARMIFTLQCVCIAVLFCFATGIEAVAHERLQSPAFDPLKGFETRRLRVNLRYLQNTLEQLVLFVAGLFGLALYSPDGEAMRAVAATTLVWILTRLAFWIGYHRSAAMRGLGAPGMALSLLVLLYVAARIGFDWAGITGAAGIVAAFVLFEALLFRATRGTPGPI